MKEAESSSHDPSPTILFLGDNKSGKEKIVQAVLGDSSSRSLAIDTKYYTARASIVSAEDIDPSKALHIAWEAVVLIFDATR